jgi:hypothetical protein
VIRRHVQAALALAIDAGDDDAGRTALKKIDFLLRWPARRRYERSLIEAALAANEFAAFGDAEKSRHVQRVAALATAKVAVDAMDREKVAAAYARLPKPALSRAPIATLIAIVLVAGIGTGAYLVVDAMPGKASRAYARPLPPPAAGAYKDGGVPLRDNQIERLLVEEFTRLVVETSQDRESSFDNPQRKARTKRLADAPAFAAHGPALQTAWRDMLDALDKWVHEPISGPSFETINRALRTKIRAVSDQLVALGIGYYLEGDVLHVGGGVYPIIYAHRVEEVVFVTAGGKPRRVLSLRRLDRLNIVKTLLGMQSPELGDPVLMLDQIDEHVATKILPVLRHDAPFPFSDKDWMATPEGASIAKIAGKAVRAEFLAALHADAGAASQIAALIAERNTQLDNWRDELHRQGLRISRTDELFLPDGLLAQLEGKVPSSQRDRIAAIDDEIARLEGPRIASRAHQLVAATIRRHEAQHGLDDEREQMLRYPKRLEELLGPAELENGTPRRIVERARHELSAYTSQLANDPVTPQFSLWNVAQFAFSSRSWGTPESYAGILLIEGLAKHLGITSDGPIVHDRQIDRARMGRLAMELSTVPGPKLQAAAVAVWLDLFDEPIVPIVDRR